MVRRCNKLSKSKIGLDGEGEVDLLNLKCTHEWRYILCQEEGILPGYRMNKEKWISIVLNGSVAEEEVFGILDAVMN